MIAFFFFSRILSETIGVAHIMDLVVQSKKVSKNTYNDINFANFANNKENLQLKGQNRTIFTIIAVNLCLFRNYLNYN